MKKIICMLIMTIFAANAIFAQKVRIVTNDVDVFTGTHIIETSKLKLEDISFSARAVNNNIYFLIEWKNLDGSISVEGLHPTIKLLLSNHEQVKIESKYNLQAEKFIQEDGSYAYGYKHSQQYYKTNITAVFHMSPNDINYFTNKNNPIEIIQIDMGIEKYEINKRELFYYSINLNKLFTVLLKEMK